MGPKKQKTQKPKQDSEKKAAKKKQKKNEPIEDSKQEEEVSKVAQLEEEKSQGPQGESLRIGSEIKEDKDGKVPLTPTESQGEEEETKAETEVHTQYPSDQPQASADAIQQASANQSEHLGQKIESQKPDQQSYDFGNNSVIGEIKPQDSGNVASEIQAEESKAQEEVELAAEAKSHPEEEEKNATSAQVEDTVQINIQEDLGKLYAALFNQESSELNEEDLGEVSLAADPKDGDIQAVEEEEKKAEEEPFSEEALQDQQVEPDQDFSEALQTPRRLVAQNLSASSPVEEPTSQLEESKKSLQENQEDLNKLEVGKILSEDIIGQIEASSKKAETLPATQEDLQLKDLSKVDDVIGEVPSQTPHQSSKNESQEDEESKVEDLKPVPGKSVQPPQSSKSAVNIPLDSKESQGEEVKGELQKDDLSKGSPNSGPKIPNASSVSQTDEVQDEESQHEPSDNLTLPDQPENSSQSPEVQEKHSEEFKGEELKSESPKNLSLPDSTKNSTQIPDGNSSQTEQVMVEDSKSESFSHPDQAKSSSQGSTVVETKAEEVQAESPQPRAPKNLSVTDPLLDSTQIPKASQSLTEEVKEEEPKSEPKKDLLPPQSSNNSSHIPAASDIQPEDEKGEDQKLETIKSLSPPGSPIKCKSPSAIESQHQQQIMSSPLQQESAGNYFNQSSNVKIEDEEEESKELSPVSQKQLDKDFKHLPMTISIEIPSFDLLGLRDCKIVLYRAPSNKLADGLTSNQGKDQVDIQLAQAQYRDYLLKLEKAGWFLVPMKERPDHPDGVFVEDNVVFYKGVALITRPGAYQRLGEIEGLAEEIKSAFDCPVASIQEPGTLDGGDVLKIGDLILVGISSRTNEEGFRQLKLFFEQAGTRVEQIPVSGSLHLKCIITALPDGKLIYYKDRLHDDTLEALTKLGLTLLQVPEEKGVNVIVLDDKTVMVDAQAQQTIELFKSMSLQVVPVDISEFRKIDGAISCKSVRIRQLPKNSPIFSELGRGAQESWVEGQLQKPITEESKNPMLDEENLSEEELKEESKEPPKQAPLHKEPEVTSATSAASELPHEEDQAQVSSDANQLQEPSAQQQQVPEEAKHEGLPIDSEPSVNEPLKQNDQEAKNVLEAQPSPSEVSNPGPVPMSLQQNAPKPKPMEIQGQEEQKSSQQELLQHEEKKEVSSDEAPLAHENEAVPLQEEVKESLPPKDETLSQVEVPKPEGQESVVHTQGEAGQVQHQQEEEEEEEKMSTWSQPNPQTSGAAGNQDMGDESDTQMTEQHKEAKSEYDFDGKYLEKSQELTDSSHPSGTPYGDFAYLPQHQPIQLPAHQSLSQTKIQTDQEMDYGEEGITVTKPRKASHLSGSHPPGQGPSVSKSALSQLPVNNQESQKLGAVDASAVKQPKAENRQQPVSLAKSQEDQEAELKNMVNQGFMQEPRIQGVLGSFAEYYQNLLSQQKAQSEGEIGQLSMTCDMLYQDKDTLQDRLLQAESKVSHLQDDLTKLEEAHDVLLEDKKLLSQQLRDKESELQAQRSAHDLFAKEEEKKREELKSEHALQVAALQHQIDEANGKCENFQQEKSDQIVSHAKEVEEIKLAHQVEVHDAKVGLLQQKDEVTKKHFKAGSKVHQAVSKVKEDYKSNRGYIKQQLDKAVQDQVNDNQLFLLKAIAIQQKLNQQGQEIKDLTTENTQLSSQVKDVKGQLEVKVLEGQKLSNHLCDTQSKLQDESEALRLLRIEHRKALKSHSDERLKTQSLIQECEQKVSKANEDTRNAQNQQALAESKTISLQRDLTQLEKQASDQQTVMRKSTMIANHSSQVSFAANQRLISQLTQSNESAENAAQRLHESETLLQQKREFDAHRDKEISVLTQKITNIEAQMVKSRSDLEKKETEKKLIFMFAVLILVIPIILRTWP